MEKDTARGELESAGSGPGVEKSPEDGGGTARELRKALLADGRLFENLIDSMPGLLFILDDQGRYLVWNKNLEEVLGCSEEELMNRPAGFKISAKDRARVVNEIRRSDEEGRRGKQISVEYDLVLKDGKEVPYFASARATRMGDRTFIIGMSLDISARKRAEDKLRKAFAKIAELKEQLQAEWVYLQEEIKLAHNFDNIVGESAALKYVLFKVEQVAQTDATVLIQGETGTGKELVARAIHSSSPRKDRPLVKVDCTTLPSNLVENELFGHERGAFTGAHARQAGRFELAHGGTIFLDEIGELSPDLQAKLLRVIQDGEFERLGGSKTIRVDVRVLAATNRKLEQEVEKGRFREDLWYRLNVFPISVPPLRDRREDIPPLVYSLVNKYGKKFGKPVKTISQDAMNSLMSYDWPGNVRELENVIERALINTKGQALRIVDELKGTRSEKTTATQKRSLKDVEREHIVKTLVECKWRIEGKNGAASILELHPSTLRGRMRKLGIKPPWKSP
jgi:PAS domain S-box-containing protein